MLVPFAIDAESLIPDQGWTPATLRACHGSLLDVWERFGLLVHDAERFEDSALFRALSTAQLPVKVRDLWRTLLERYPPVPCMTDWCGNVTPETVGNGDPDVAVALVDDARAEVDFGFAEDEDQRTLPSAKGGAIDVCRLQAASRAGSFRRANDTAGKHVQAAETWQMIWEMRFAGLAAAPIKRIAVVDRYAAQQHCECPQAQLSGLSRFLKLLAQSGGDKRYLELFCAWTERLHGKDIDDISRDIRASIQQLNLSSIRRLDLFMVPNTALSSVAHDRFIRFGPYVWDIGLGLEIFQGPCAGKVSSAAFKVGATVGEYARIEDRLRQEHGVKRARVIG